MVDNTSCTLYYTAFIGFIVNMVNPELNVVHAVTFRYVKCRSKITLSIYLWICTLHRPYGYSQVIHLMCITPTGPQIRQQFVLPVVCITHCVYYPLCITRCVYYPLCVLPCYPLCIFTYCVYYPLCSCVYLYITCCVSYPLYYPLCVLPVVCITRCVYYPLCVLPVVCITRCVSYPLYYPLCVLPVVCITRCVYYPLCVLPFVCLTRCVSYPLCALPVSWPPYARLLFCCPWVPDWLRPVSYIVSPSPCSTRPVIHWPLSGHSWGHIPHTVNMSQQLSANTSNTQTHLSIISTSTDAKNTDTTVYFLNMAFLTNHRHLSHHDDFLLKSPVSHTATHSLCITHSHTQPVYHTQPHTACVSHTATHSLCLEIVVCT